MVSSPKGLGPEKDCAGKPAAHTKDRPDLSSERAPHKYKTVTVTQVIKIWSSAPDGCFIPRQTGRLTVGRNIRLRLRLRLSPCGGGVEYIHRNPASRRRRWKGKSRIWVLRDSDPKMTALARASSNCKRQTRPLVREVAPNQQTRNCQPVIKIWS
jgi:hypothetical protein